MGRFLGFVFLALATLLPGLSFADNCPAAWSERASRNAQDGLAQFKSGTDFQLVALWRSLVLNDRTPGGYHSRTALATWWNPTPFETYREATARFAGATSVRRSYGGGAFGYAISLLGERMRLLGVDHPYVKAWIANQAIVYGYLGTGIDNPINLPKAYDPAIAGVPAGMAADDHDYQLASVRYYAGAYGLALADFRRIAAGQSRHRLAAAYMVPKTFAMMANGAAALREIDAILADPTLQGIHVGTQQLYGFLRMKLRKKTEAESGPVYVEVKRRALVFDADIMTLPAAVIESDPELTAAFQAAVFNLAFYLRGPTDNRSRRESWREDWWLDTETGGAFGAAAKEREILDWLQAARGTIPYANRRWTVYLSQWTQGPDYARINAHIADRADTSANQLPWLVLSQARRRGTDSYRESRPHPALGELEARMASCTTSEPEQVAYGPLQAQAMRLATMADDWVGLWARGWGNWQEHAAGYLESSTDIADRARRLGFPDVTMDKMPMLALASLADVATRLQGGRAMHDDLASLLNLLPAATLLPLLDDRRIVLEHRAALARMAWLRAHLLGKSDLQEKLTPYLVALNPEMTALVDEVDRRWSETGRRLSELRLLLATPGLNLRIPMSYQMWAGYSGARPNRELRITDSHNPSDANWWCQLSPGGEYAFLETAGFDQPLGLSRPATGWYYYEDAVSFRVDTRDHFRTLREGILKWHPLVRLIDWSELGELSKIEAAPRYLGRQVIDLVRQSAWYDRWYYADDMAELLGLVIRATRFGCRRDGSDGDISREAFVLLHQMFPESEAAKATRYWYN